MISRRTSLVRTGATLAVAALLAAGCSSSKSTPAASSSGTGGATSASSTGAASSSDSANSSSTTPSGSDSSGAAGGQPSDVAGATQDVTNAYNKFFDNTIDNTTRASLVENAAKIQPLITALAAGANGAKSSIKVNSVTFASATHAKVDFAILLNGQPALPHANGDAIYDSASSHWQVADTTLCQLAGLLPGVNPDVLKSAGCS